MNVLILGSGGREHALAWKVAQSSHIDQLFVIPGNPGMTNIASCVDLDPMDNDRIKTFVKQNHIGLVIPGSEVYLENGIADELMNEDVFVFGPTKKGALLESSKEFAKELMKHYHIPTADYQVFDQADDAYQYIEEKGVPIVIKYNGLAGGKGVVVAMTMKEAYAAIDTMLVQKKYGSSNVVIEEFLTGPEFSLMTFVHDNQVIPMPIAQDHKRLLDGDLGPNTGGMGIYSSVPIIPEDVIQETMDTIMKPVVEALQQEGISYTGFLYGGLMLTEEGPKVIEFNARFGDPETEVILPKLKTDILDIILSLKNHTPVDIEWSTDYVVGVVMASNGYPASYEKGYLIQGMEQTDSIVFHMGTSLSTEGLITNGGRVLLVTGIGSTLQEAQKNAYQNVSKIKCENLIYRKDIGYKAL